MYTSRHRLMAAIALALTSALGVYGAHGAPGDLDASFGNGSGAVTANLGQLPSKPPYNQFIAVAAIQSDNKIVVATSNRDFRLSRYHANGTLDQTFGINGVATIDVGSDDTPRGIVVQPNGKIVVAGTRYIDSPNSGYYPDGVVAARFNSNGSIDTTFGGGDGIAQIDPLPDQTASALGLALQRDGKLVIVGYGHRIPDGETATDAFVLRLNTNGTADSSFGQNGTAKLDVGGNERFYSVALQDDGRIAVTGTANGLGALSARFTQSGVLDTSFGSGGWVYTPMGNDSGAVALSIRPDRKWLITGLQPEAGGGYDYVLARYHPNGLIDSTFGAGGLVVTDVSAIRNVGGDLDLPHSLAIQANGKIVVGGESGYTEPNYFTLVRYAGDGQLDPTFSVDGVAEMRGSYATGIAITPNGKIIAAGIDRTAYNRPVSLILSQYQGDNLDLTPGAIAFVDRTPVALRTVQTSNEIIVSGLTTDTYVPVRVSGGTRSINGAGFTALPGWVKNGDRIRVRHTSSARYATKTHTVLTVGGLHAPNNPALVLGQKTVDTFTSTTRNAR